MACIGINQRCSSSLTLGEKVDDEEQESDIHESPCCLIPCVIDATCMILHFGGLTV